METENVDLFFINFVGEDFDNMYRYEFIFTDKIDEAFGENFSIKPCCLVHNLTPSEEYIYEIHIVKTKFKFNLIQENCCFSYQDCIDGIISLAYYFNEEDLSDCIYFNFGDNINDIKVKLANKNILLD